jgi:long-chain-fatty-acid--CoA ligase ACSBG
MKSVKPNLFFGVPRVWEKLEAVLKSKFVADPDLTTEGAKESIGLQECTVFSYGAAALKYTSVEFFDNLKMPLFNIYGMSENTGPFVLMSHDKYSLKTTGYPIPSMDLLIDEPDQSGEGEVCMRGRNIMNGYLKNEEATRKAIDLNGFLHTGDRGRHHPDDFLEITGRIKELILTSGGENVAPVPIEDIFKMECLPCSNVMVVGEGERFVAALITFKVVMDPVTGLPTEALMAEAVTFF